MSEWFAGFHQFHLLRPWWLLAAVPALALALSLLRRHNRPAGWQQVIAPQLLTHLIDSEQQRQQRWPWWLLLIAWLLATLAMAGPTWQKLPQPVQQRQDALVIVLDLSLSMYAEDVQPSRLTAARHKILDVLEQRSEGLTGLVAYSGDAHVVSPLTDDSATIANLVPALAPEMMPIAGSNPRHAIDLARDLFTNSGVGRGRILWLTDGITDKDADVIAGELSGTDYALSIAGVGTEQGAPIPLPNGFLKDDSGTIVVPTLKREPFRELANELGARYMDLQLDNSDLRFLLPDQLLDWEEAKTVDRRQFDQWLERGPWLVMLCLPLALLGFRRGWLFGLIAVLWLPSQPAQALDWEDLWLRPDQQGARAMERDNYEAAADTFRNSQWRGSAQYRAGDYEAAAQSFAQRDSADAHYNRGNALAKAGQYRQAIEAYEQALARDPELSDAAANKQLLEQLLDQRQQQQGDGQQQEHDSDQQGEQGQQSQQDAQGEGQQNEPQDSAQQGAQQNRQDQQDRQQQGGEGQQDQQQQDRSSGQRPDQPRQQQQQGKQGDQEAQQQQGREQSREPARDQQREQQAQAQDSDGEQPQPSTTQPLSAEEKRRQQAMEQWLRQIPDDPSGLLRNKFHYEYRKYRQQGTDVDEDQPLW